MKMRLFKLSVAFALLFSAVSTVTLAQEPAIDLQLQCTQTKLEDGDYGTHTVQDGIVVVKKRAVIPHGTVI